MPAEEETMYRRTFKRLLDMSAAFCLLGLLAPVMGFIAMLVWFNFGRPIIFSQLRPGLNGRLFKVFKFRTMTITRDANGGLLPDDARMTPFGRFLRGTSLDELPELLNVLRGEMSMVGPRPLLAAYLARYDAHQFRRHNVKPGITGLTQVSGRNAITWDQKFELDIRYVENYSFWLDLRILSLTIWKILIREGINQPGRATMDEFRGGLGQGETKMRSGDARWARE
jgi:lipopolysaccharide/colanic/teichoic acid biosynthesis glycosyltransferase